MDRHLWSIRMINRERSAQWHGEGDDVIPWTGADWSNAMQSEAGEAGNVVKKLRRLETGVRDGKQTKSKEDYLVELADEIADTFLYLDLLADYYGIDMMEAIRNKFNRTSEEYGFSQTL